MLGDRDIAVTLDGVDANAARLDLSDIHVTRRAGAEKDDVFERAALRDQLGRHVGMVVDADVVALQQPRQLGAFKRLTVDVDRRIVATHDAFPNGSQLIVAIDEEGFHQCATIGCAASVGWRGAMPVNGEPCSNQEAGAGWPHRVCRCGSVSDQRIGT